jgi:metal-dependent amidase/aminoacylase/carboxypeptidase family protein
MASDIVINIASQFTGKKAFKQADTATEKLNKSVKKLASAIGLAYGTTAVIAFGKASVRAAAADQKAQQQLALALKNVGLGRDAASSEAYIQRLQSEFGIVDDKLRPAYQTLAVATRDTEQSQKLLNLALDISASTGKDLSSVTGALSKAFLGNNTALSKLGVGISKADLKAKSFDDVVGQLTTTFAGSATAAANTFQGSIDKLGVASSNVKEIIGTGLIDALKNLGQDTSISELATNMEKTATYLADVIRGVGALSSKLKDIPVLGGLNVGMIPIVGSYIELLRKAGTKTAELTSADNAHLQSLQSAYKIGTKTLTNSKALTKETTAQLKAAKLKNAVDKANAALGAGADVFDMDQIQLNAALINQAQQLGNTTNAAQILAISNDIARLNVKRSMYELEQAIASGDIAAIETATSKLNADLKILGALTGQKETLATIKSILDSLLPKDLINLQNLRDAIALLNQINTPGAGGGNNNGGGFVQTPNGISPTTAPRSIADINAATEALGGVPTFIGPGGIEITPDTGMLSGISPGGREFNFSVTVNAGIGDPNAIAEAVNQVIQDAVDRGTLRGGAY